MAAESTGQLVRSIRVLAVGRLSEPLLRSVLQHLSETIPVPCLLEEDASPDGLPWISGREQVDADLLLERLEARPRPEGEALLCVIDRDMGSRIFSYFFGRARLEGRVALVATARLDPAFYGLPPDERLLVERVVKEMRHELGHNAGLVHCEDQDCLMHFSADVEALDLRGRDYCGRCAPVAAALFAG